MSVITSSSQGRRFRCGWRLTSITTCEHVSDITINACVYCLVADVRRSAVRRSSCWKNRTVCATTPTPSTTSSDWRSGRSAQPPRHHRRPLPTGAQVGRATTPTPSTTSSDSRSDTVLRAATLSLRHGCHVIVTSRITHCRCITAASMS